VYELVDTCGVYELVYVIYMCYLVACYLVYVCQRGKWREGPSAKAPLLSAPRAITLGNSGKNFPARVFPALPSIVARGARQRIFFKKIKNCLCRRPLPGTLGTGFSQKKIEKEHLPTAFARGSRHRFFQKKK
jgi:uncharacterized SAM-binding protein YcdF (DUF218 family)